MDIPKFDSDRLPQTLKRSIWSYDEGVGGDIIALFLGNIKFLFGLPPRGFES